MIIDNENTNITDNLKLIEYSEISASFPDEWILLANPVFDENSEVLKGIVLFHSKDKREVCYKGRDKVKEYQKISVIFTGQYNIQRRVGIMKRV